MKRITAALLVIVLMLSSGFTVQAESTASPASVPDGKLTLAILEQITSWEELYNTVHPITDEVLDKIENKEDYYCVLLIERINQRKTIPYSHDEEYVSSFLDIELKKIEFNRFVPKIAKIISIYNDSNDLHLVWEHWYLKI